MTALVAAAVERGRALGEARQRVGPGLPVERVVEIGIGVDEELPGLVRMVEVDRGLLDRVEEARQAVVPKPGG